MHCWHISLHWVFIRKSGEWFKPSSYSKFTLLTFFELTFRCFVFGKSRLMTWELDLKITGILFALISTVTYPVTELAAWLKKFSRDLQTSLNCKSLCLKQIFIAGWKNTENHYCFLKGCWALTWHMDGICLTVSTLKIIISAAPTVNYEFYDHNICYLVIVKWHIHVFLL